MYCPKCGVPIMDAGNVGSMGSSMKVEESYRKDRTLKEQFFSYKGRLNRLRFIKRILLIWIIISIISSLRVTDPGSMNIFATIISIPFIVSYFMLVIRRLHDLNRTGLCCLWLCVPLINILFLIYVYCFKGTSGSNKYGPDPLGTSI